MSSMKPQNESKSVHNKQNYVKLPSNHASSVTHNTTSDEYKLLRIRAWLVTIGGFLVANNVGAMWSFGNIVPYLSSYWTYIHFHKHVPNCYDESDYLSNHDRCDEIADKYKSFTNLTVWTYATLMAFWCGFGFLGGYFELYLGPRKACLVGAVFTATGFGVTYFTCYNFYFTTLTLGALLGASLALVFVVPIVTVIRWWPHNRALFTSVITLGGSVGGVWMDYIQTLYINNEGLKDDQTYGFVCDKEIMDRFPQIFFVLAATLFIVMSTGGALLSNPPKHYIDVLNKHRDMKKQQQQQQQYQQDQQSQNDNNLDSSAHAVAVAGATGTIMNTTTTPSRITTTTTRNGNIAGAIATHLQNTNTTSSTPSPGSRQISNGTLTDSGNNCNNNININTNCISNDQSHDTHLPSVSCVSASGPSIVVPCERQSSSIVSMDAVSSLMGIGNEYDEKSSIFRNSSILEDGVDSSLLITMSSQKLASAAAVDEKPPKNLNVNVNVNINEIQKEENAEEELSQSESFSDERLDRVSEPSVVEINEDKGKTGEINKGKTTKYSKVEIPKTKEEIADFLAKDMPVFAYTTKEAFSSFKFYQIACIDLLNVIIISFVVSEWKIFANNYLDIENDGFLVLLGSFSSIFNVVGRVGVALLFDYSKSFKISMASVTSIMAIFISSICISDLWYSEELLFVWICVLSACTGGNYALYPSAISQAFGIKNSGVILGFVYVAELPAVASQAFLFDNITGIIGGWLHLSIIMGIGAGISTILALTFNTQNKHKIEFLRNNGVKI